MLLPCPTGSTGGTIASIRLTNPNFTLKVVRRNSQAPQIRVVPCRVCFEPLEVDPKRTVRLAGRTFMECGTCRSLIWIRRRDLRHAIVVEDLSAAQPASDDEDTRGPARPSAQRSDMSMPPRAGSIAHHLG